MKDMEDIITDWLSGECSADEKNRLDAWIRESPENKEYFIQRREVWFSSMISEEKERFEPLRAFSKFLMKKNVLPRRPTRRHRWIRIAAGFVAVAFVTGLLLSPILFRQKSVIPDTLSFVTQRGSRTSLKLPDGTQVWLNSESELRYSTEYGKTERRVELKGEAYFNVRHDDDVPFFVSSGEITVTDLGTIFTVTNYDDEGTLSTSLIEGSIAFQIEGDISSQELMPGHTVTYDKSKGTSKITQNTTDATGSCIRGEYVFVDEPLASITRKLERGLNVNIDIEDEDLCQLRFNGHFNDSITNAGDILETLSVTGRFHIETKSEGYAIRR